MNTFTKRKIEKVVLKSIDGECVQWEGSWGHSVPKHVIPALVVGGTYYLETYKFNEVGGIMQDDGLYLFHRSDEYFAMKLADYLAKSKQRQIDNYLNNKENWQDRTETLSPRYKTRIERFLNDPDKGQEFREEGMGWGYELIICELAQMYEKSGGVDDDEIMLYSRTHGTSGNQHDCAKARARNQDVKI